MGSIWRSVKIITGLFCAMPTAVVAMPAAVVVIALTQLVGNNTSAQAAETVVVRFGLFAESIPVADLQTAAETGKFPESLNSYTKHLSQSQQDLILGALRTNVPMNVVTVSRLLNTEIGIALLNNMSTALVRQDTAGVQALRAGFVLGSNAPKGLSILSFIDAYPSKNLEINLPEAFTVAKNLNAGFWLTQQFMLAISPLLNPANLLRE